MQFFEALKYGIGGLGLALAVLAFWLLQNEQRRTAPRREMLVSVGVFMLFSIALTLLSFFSQSAPSDQTVRSRSVPDTAFNGLWHVQGNDIDFLNTDFHARNTYEGDLDFKVKDGRLLISGTLATYNDKTHEHKGSAKFIAEGPIRDNQVAAYYDYVNERVSGFGTIFIQTDFAGLTGKAYLTFRVTTGDGYIGQAELTMSRATH